MWQRTLEQYTIVQLHMKVRWEHNSPEMSVCERTYKLLVGQLTSILVTCTELQEKIHTVNLLFWNVSPEGGWRPSAGDDFKTFPWNERLGEATDRRKQIHACSSLNAACAIQ